MASVLATDPQPESALADDWTFSGAATRDLTHCYHDYPARMIPQIARKLLDLFGRDAQTLFDPYCGTGTSLVEGRVRGLAVAGTDLNPLARRIAFVKTATISLPDLDSALRHLERFVEDDGQKTLTLLPTIDAINRLEFWFKPVVVEKLAHLRAFIDRLDTSDDSLRGFFEVAFSETVRECSNTRNNEFKLYRMAADKLESFSPPVYEVMQNKLRRNRLGLAAFLRQLNGLPASPPFARLFDFNTVEAVPHTAVAPNSIDLVLTSPPYGDSGTTVAYGQYSRLSAAWLGLSEPEKVDRKLMGGTVSNRIPRFASAALNTAIDAIYTVEERRAYEVASFYADMEASIAHVGPLVRDGGYVCYVVGNRRVKGITLPTDNAVRCAFERQGFVWQTTFVRTIPNKRMPLRNSPSNVAGALDATMTSEYIVVLRR